MRQQAIVPSSIKKAFYLLVLSFWFFGIHVYNGSSELLAKSIHSSIKHLNLLHDIWFKQVGGLDYRGVLIFSWYSIDIWTRDIFFLCIGPLGVHNMCVTCEFTQVFLTGVWSKL